MQTVNIVDYEIKSSLLAKVIISYTGNPSREFLRAELARKLDNMAAPVMNSFKQVKPGQAVGFIRANRAVRAVTAEKLKASYRVLSAANANVLMSNDDKSLWEVKEGAAGKYLARYGQEDLSSLVAAAVQRRPDAVRVSQLAIAAAAASELVAFVADDGDVDHGFALRTGEDKVEVLSFARRVPLKVSYGNVVSIYPVDIDRNIHRQVMASLTPAEKKQSRDYYERLFSFAPDYLAQVIDMVNNPTVL